jgi:hypothetical protein
MAGMNRSDQKRYRKRHGLPDLERYKWVDKPLGPVRGTPLLYDRFDPVHRLPELAAEIANCFGALRQYNRWTSITISTALRQLNDLLDRLERDINNLKAPLEFFDYSHLAALSEWAKHRSPPVEFKIGLGYFEGEITVRGHYEGYVHRIPEKAELEKGYQPPSVDFISNFRKAIQ